MDDKSAPFYEMCFFYCIKASGRMEASDRATQANLHGIVRLRDLLSERI